MQDSNSAMIVDITGLEESKYLDHDVTTLCSFLIDVHGRLTTLIKWTNYGICIPYTTFLSFDLNAYQYCMTFSTETLCWYNLSTTRIFRIEDSHNEERSSRTVELLYTVCIYRSSFTWLTVLVFRERQSKRNITWSRYFDFLQIY